MPELYHFFPGTAESSGVDKMQHLTIALLLINNTVTTLPYNVVIYTIWHEYIHVVTVLLINNKAIVRCCILSTPDDSAVPGKKWYNSGNMKWFNFYKCSKSSMKGYLYGLRWKKM